MTSTIGGLLQCLGFLDLWQMWVGIVFCNGGVDISPFDFVEIFDLVLSLVFHLNLCVVSCLMCAYLTLEKKCYYIFSLYKKYCTIRKAVIFNYI